MTPANPIPRFRRDLTFSSIIQSGLFVAAFVAMLLSVMPGGAIVGNLLFAGIVVAWLALSYRSAKSSRINADSPGLIAAGRFREAEQRIEGVVGSFGLFRNVKLVGLHHLALLRHAEKRFHDSAALCQLILRQRLGGVKGLAKPTRLILADSAMEMGDVRGAYDAIASLYRERLSLTEALTLLNVQSDYLMRIGAWDQLFDLIERKASLAELMPPTAAARTQAMLALAARRLGREDWANWLRKRVELLVDPNELIAQRPMLAELWTPAPQADLPAGNA